MLRYAVISEDRNMMKKEVEMTLKFNDFFFLAQQPKARQGRIILEVHGSQTMAHYIR
jgi:hypothetical protein